MHDAASILVVDDQEINRDLLERWLEHLGYSAHVAEDGFQALDMIHGMRIDLVLLDVMMPKMDGLEVLELIRAEYSHSRLPVIMVTAKDESSNVVESLSLGANDYVTKPIELPVLHARMKTQLALKRAEDDLRQINQELEEQVEERSAAVISSLQALQVSEQRYQTLYDENPVMFYTLDADANILSLNFYGANQLGYEVDELLGQSSSMLYPKDDENSLKARINTCLQHPGNAHQWELHKVHKEGGLVRVRETVRTVNGSDGKEQLLVVCEDITEAHQLAEKLSYKERYDELTGLISRKEFECCLEKTLRRVRNTKTPSSLCYMDLDQFKVINDTCGHDVGDELLRRLAELMSRQVRREDILARMSGDEYGLLIDNCSPEQSEQFANKLRKIIENYRFSVAGKQFQVSVSIGLVMITEAIRNVSDLLSAADTACYMAKEEGRNRIHIYQKNDKEMQRRYGEMRWVSRIHEALAKDLFQLYYQTIVPTGHGNGDEIHYEVLVRMSGKGGSTILPGAFLSAAERYFLSPKIDRWVVGAAFRWLAENPVHLKQLGLCSINLSGHSLADEDFPGFLLERFSTTGIPPEKICFEITETAAIANIGAATRLIEKMRSLGCSFSLDDFGSGLSSFAYLKCLPVDFIKIDGQFVKEIADSAVDKAMVKSIHDVAQVMGKRTIAEFVENENILDVLRAIGVDYAQGYGISRPTPINELTLSLADNYTGLAVAGVVNE